jgi:hypothetical protein
MPPTPSTPADIVNESLRLHMLPDPVAAAAFVAPADGAPL